MHDYSLESPQSRQSAQSLQSALDQVPLNLEEHCYDTPVGARKQANQYTEVILQDKSDGYTEVEPFTRALVRHRVRFFDKPLKIYIYMNSKEPIDCNISESRRGVQQTTQK